MGYAFWNYLVINIPGFEDMVAQKVCIDLKIYNHVDKDKLADAKRLTYVKGFIDIVSLIGKYKRCRSLPQLTIQDEEANPCACCPLGALHYFLLHLSALHVRYASVWNDYTNDITSAKNASIDSFALNYRGQGVDWGVQQYYLAKI